MRATRSRRWRRGRAKHLLTVRASAFRPAAKGNAAPIEPYAEGPLTEVVRVLGAQRTESDRPELTTAQIVVSGGVSVGSAEGFELIERLAEALGAAVGATRAAVDAGYAPNDWQVGQTGQDHCAGPLYCGWDFRGAAAPRGHPGGEDDRRDQHRCRGADDEDRGFCAGGGFVRGGAGADGGAEAASGRVGPPPRGGQGWGQRGSMP